MREIVTRSQVDRLGQIWSQVAVSKAGPEGSWSKAGCRLREVRIRPVEGNAVLVFWFGGMAFDLQPSGEQVKNSVTLRQAKLVASDGSQIGLDSRGQNPDKTFWRPRFPC